MTLKSNCVMMWYLLQWSFWSYHPPPSHISGVGDNDATLNFNFKISSWSNRDASNYLQSIIKQICSKRRWKRRPPLSITKVYLQHFFVSTLINMCLICVCVYTAFCLQPVNQRRFNALFSNKNRVDNSLQERCQTRSPPEGPVQHHGWLCIVFSH